MEYPGKTPFWRRYLRFVRRDVPADVDDELRFHFDARIDELMSQGTSAESARTQALEEFGEVAEVRRGLEKIGGRIERLPGFLGFKGLTERIAPIVQIEPELTANATP